MGIHDKDKKKKKREAKKAISGIYKNADQRYINAENRYTDDKKKSEPIVEEKKVQETKFVNKPISLHPLIEARLTDSNEGFDILYTVNTAGIGIWGIIRELFPIYEAGSSAFKSKVNFTIKDNNLSKDGKIVMGQVIKVEISKGEPYAFRKWKEDPEFIYYGTVNTCHHLTEIVKQIYSYSDLNIKNKEDRDLLKTYFPYMVHDDLAKDKYVKMLKWNSEIFKREGEGEYNFSAELGDPLVYKMEAQDIQVREEANDFKDFKKYDERSPASLPFADLELELLERVMKKYQVSYADVYGNDISEDEMKANPFRGKEFGHISTHGSGENTTPDKEVKTKEESESFILTQESFGKEADKNKGKVYTSDVMKEDMSSLFLMYYSACQTAQDKNWTNEEKEHLSMMEATLKAGARNVIGNSWNVNDYVQPFMSYIFYNELLGDPERDVVRALRKSQQLLRVFFDEPKYWGSFQLLSQDYKKEDYVIGDKFRNELSETRMDDASFEDGKINDRRKALADHDPDFRVLWNKYNNYLEVMSGTSDNQNISPAQAEQYLKASRIEIVMYENMLKEEDRSKKEVKNLQEKLGENEGVVELKRLDGAMEVQYVALVTGKANKTRPIPVVVSANKNSSKTIPATPESPLQVEQSNTMEGKMFNYYKNITKFTANDDNSNMENRAYEVFWARIQEELDRQGIKRVYLAKEGVYQEMSINVLQEVFTDPEGRITKAEYVFDKIEIINLY